MAWQYLILIPTTLFHFVMSWRERQTLTPPGDLIDLGGYQVHCWIKGTGKATVVLDHSLGGIEGYLLIEAIAKIAKICIYDRLGYGWSDRSPKPRCSEEIVRELDLMLTKARLKPPYILVGDSFGSYNVRLYAHRFPEKVKGIVLTDGLHESGMLSLPRSIVAVKYLFISGFVMSVFGSWFGIIRLLGTIGLFEVIKPKLKRIDRLQCRRIKRSFYRARHWLTMAQELMNLDRSGHQTKVAQTLNIPIASIKSQTFFQPSWLTFFLPRKAIDGLRDKMHRNLSTLSADFTSVPADKSSHFIWTDQPEIIVRAVQQLIDRELRF